MNLKMKILFFLPYLPVLIYGQTSTRAHSTTPSIGQSTTTRILISTLNTTTTKAPSGALQTHSPAITTQALSTPSVGGSNINPWVMSFTGQLVTGVPISKVVVLSNILIALDTSGALKFYRNVTQNLSYDRIFSKSIVDFEVMADPSSTDFFIAYLLYNFNSGLKLERYSIDFDTLTPVAEYAAPEMISRGSSLIADVTYKYLFVVGNSTVYKYDILELDPELISSQNVTLVNGRNLDICNSNCAVLNDGFIYATSAKSNLTGIYQFDMRYSSQLNSTIIAENRKYQALYKYTDDDLLVSLEDNSVGILSNSNVVNTGLRMTKNMLVIDDVVLFAQLTGNKVPFARYDGQSWTVQYNGTLVRRARPACFYSSSTIVFIPETGPGLDIYNITSSVALNNWFKSNLYGIPKSVVTITNPTVLERSDALALQFSGIVNFSIIEINPYDTISYFIIYNGITQSSIENIVFVQKYELSTTSWVNLAKGDEVDKFFLDNQYLRVYIDQIDYSALEAIQWPIVINFEVTSSRGVGVKVNVTIVDTYVAPSTSGNPGLGAPASRPRSMSQSTMASSASLTIISTQNVDAFSALQIRLGGFTNFVVILALAVLAFILLLSALFWCASTKKSIGELEGMLKNQTQYSAIPNAPVVPIINSAPSGFGLQSPSVPISPAPFSGVATGNFVMSSVPVSPALSVPRPSTSLPLGVPPKSTIIAPVLAFPADLKWTDGDFSLINRLKTGANENELYEGELSMQKQAIHRVSKCLLKIVKGYDHHDEGDRLGGILQEVGIMYVFREHPNFCKIYGYIESPITLVMQYCVRGSLDEFLPSLTSQLIVQISKDISEFLNAFHTAGFSHNAVKSSNILLDQDSYGQIRACVGDFGHATFADAQLQKANGERKGKKETTYARYSAPELLGPNPPNPNFIKANDIFSMGVVLFELLAMEKAWSSATDAASVTNMVLAGQRSQMPQMRMNIIYSTPSLNAIFQLMNNCWVQDPAARPNSDEVRMALIKLS